MGYDRPCDYNITVDIPEIYGRDVKLQGKSQVMPLYGADITTEPAVEALGIPMYIKNPEMYSEFGITETGWYIFARIVPVKGVVVTGSTEVSGAAGYIAEIGNAYIDVAIRFGVQGLSQRIVIDWGDGKAEKIVFASPDLSRRNMDYLATYYVYEAVKFATWEYAHATDSVFVDKKNYYIKQDGEYVKVKVIIGDPLPEAVYVQTTDGYAQTDDENFVAGTVYYHKNGDEYLPVEVTAGEHIPAYYIDTKLIISADTLTRNITYRIDALIDCPMEFILPNVEDETHGCWFELRCHHAGAYSMTLTPPTSDIKIATEHTQKETEGINMINLHYTAVDGQKVWRFMNTHSTFTVTRTPEALSFRTAPVKTEYAAGEQLDLTGADLLVTYTDGTQKNVTGNCTFTPVSGTTLTAENTELVASLTENGTTVTATIPLTIQ